MIVPAGVVLAFLALAVATYLLDHSNAAAVTAAREALQRHVFGAADRTGDVLSAVATGIITMTSITVSVLLVALQQSSTNLTPQVFDQFVRRRENQAFFGAFIGLAVYALIALSTVTEHFNPVLTAVFVLLLAIGALIAMVVLLYAVVNEMRPTEIITKIHDSALRAREHQRELLARTRRTPRLGGVPVEVRATSNGFVSTVDVDSLGRVAERLDAEIELAVAVGTFVGMNDVIAKVRGLAALDDGVAARIRDSVEIARHRNLDGDPSYALEQLQVIGWAAISSAKHARESGLLCIRSLVDVLGRWADDANEHRLARTGDERARIVYRDDVLDALFDSIESLGLVTGESLQARCCAEVIAGIDRVYPRLPRDYRVRADDLLARVLAATSDVPAARSYDAALAQLSRTLYATGSASLAMRADRIRGEHERRVLHS